MACIEYNERVPSTTATVLVGPPTAATTADDRVRVISRGYRPSIIIIDSWPDEVYNNLTEKLKDFDLVFLSMADMVKGNFLKGLEFLRSYKHIPWKAARKALCQAVVQKSSFCRELVSPPIGAYRRIYHRAEIQIQYP